MKYLKYYVTVLAVVVFSACQKKEVAEPSSSISPDLPYINSVNAYKAAANTDIKFVLDGTADFITFYSGEAGKEYQYKDRTTSTSGAAISPDKGVAIKGLSDNTLSSYTYKYAAVGTYTATFVVTNRTSYGTAKTVVISIPISTAP